VREGEFYGASTWAKVYAATGETQVVLSFYGDDHSPVQEFASSAVAGTADWQKLGVAAQVPAEASRARVILRSRANEGAAWFDDIELMRVDEATCERMNASKPQTDRLVLHMPFDGDVHDHSPFALLNGPIVSMSGGQQAVLLQPAEQQGWVLALDGKDDFVEIPHSGVEDVLSPPQAMTISLWLKADRPGPAFVCGKVAEAGDTAVGYRLDLTSDARIQFSVAADGKLEPAAEQAVPIGQWAHVAAVRKADGTLCVSVGGKPGAPVERPRLYQSSPRSFYIGADYGVRQFLAGRIDDLRLYREALSPQEISVLASGQD